MLALILVMAYISLIIGCRGFGGKDNLWEIIFPESDGGVTFDRPIMAYISLTITRGGEDNL